MERSFYRAGERVPVTKVDGVLAVRAQEIRRAPGEAASFGEPATGPVPATVTPGAPGAAATSLQVPDDEAEALAQDGWLLVRPSEDLDAAARSDAPLPVGVSAVGAVYQEHDGHVLIATDRLVVQFSPDISAEEARGRLDEDGLREVRPLKAAPNQYEVAIPPGADLLDVVATLHESEGTVYAEPTFVEFGRRRRAPAARPPRQ